jgi:hypothetical protein
MPDDDIIQKMRDVKPAYQETGGLMGPQGSEKGAPLGETDLEPDTHAITTPLPRFDFKIIEQITQPAFPALQPEAAEVIAQGGGDSIVNFPFKVTPSQDDSGGFVTVFPGLVDKTVPEMGGIGLDDDPPPKLYVTSLPLWLKVFTKLSADPSDYRAVIDPDNPPLIFQSTDHTELQMTWTGSPADYSSGTGYFFVKIADIAVSSDGFVVTPTQYLYNHLRSIVLTVDNVLILA